MFKTSLKSKLIIAVMVMFGITTTFMSCEKTEEVLKPSTTQSQNDEYYFDKQLNLNDFIKTLETKEEKEFFIKNKITDNTKVAEKVLNSYQKLKSANEVKRPKIKFRWGGSGCSRPLGICIIIPIGKLEANADALITDGKYVIIPDNDDNGITADGYLPIFEDIYVDETTTIKAGIYTANYDEEQNKYSAIALDIK